MAFDRLRRVLGAASLDYRHLIFLNIYVTATMPEDTVARLLPKYLADRTNVAISTTHVPALPFGAAIGIHGVATSHLRPRQRSGNCLGADGTIYCGQYTADDYRSALVGLPAILQKLNGGAIPQIAASYVMMGDLKEFTTMNGIYAEVMPSPFPTRTTVQPMPAGQGPKFRWSVIAER
jgi:enamine deaminase RidA (YjgF/YER057c/UK114 family)